MADEIRVSRDETVYTPDAGVRPTPGDSPRITPADAAPTRVPDYDDPRDARADIEATRARLSGTIDEIEDVLVRKKTEIQERLDVVAPVRENPWPSMGIALGAGLFLGLLTGGDDEEDDETEGRTYAAAAWPAAVDRTQTRAWEQRAEMLEARTQRLLSIARDQEEEIRRLRGKKKKKRASVSDRLDDGYEELSDYAEEGSHRFEELRSSLVSGLSSFLLQAFREYRRRR